MNNIENIEDEKVLEENLDETTETKNKKNDSEEKEEMKKELTTDEIIANLKLEINDWKKEYSIKLADFENYKKRKDKELQEYKKYACEGLIVSQVENMDILSMAISSAKENHDIDALIEGLEMLFKNIKTNLENEGLEEIETLDKKYDPYLHQAVSTVNNSDLEDDIIVQVLQKGYKLKSKVIRPAMVVINKK